MLTYHFQLFLVSYFHPRSVILPMTPNAHPGIVVCVLIIDMVVVRPVVSFFRVCGSANFTMFWLSAFRHQLFLFHRASCLSDPSYSSLSIFYHFSPYIKYQGRGYWTAPRICSSMIVPFTPPHTFFAHTRCGTAFGKSQWANFFYHFHFTPPVW
jgi:hypothetical protein